MYYSLKDLEHHPKLANALGNMVIAWAFADTTLFSTIARITGIGLNMAMAGYYRIPTFESRIKFILAITEDWKTDKFDKAAIVRAVEKLSGLSSARNHWVHGDWCETKDHKDIIIFDQRAALGSPHRKKPVKAADVENHNKAVRIRTDALAELIKRDELEA